MYKTIAVIYGSDSSEWEVACRSGEFTASRIDETKYDVYEIFARFGKWSLAAFRKQNSMRVTFPEEARPEIDKTDFSVSVLGEKIKFDYVYIMQHGAPGENGLMQGYLEMLGIPFSSCSAFVSAVAFNKYSCKCYLKALNFVKLAPDFFLHDGMDVDDCVGKIKAGLKFPVFVKPTNGGSSFGITKVKKAEDLGSAINFAFTEGSAVIVEEGITGREFTCAAYISAGELKTLPVIEIITENEYFDYDAKYNGNSREVCPAEISDKVRDKVQDATRRIYKYLGCAGIVRMDYIMSGEELYFLEVNTIPGMTSASLVPKMVKADGQNMTDFLTGIIESR